MAKTRSPDAERKTLSDNTVSDFEYPRRIVTTSLLLRQNHSTAGESILSPYTTHPFTSPLLSSTTHSHSIVLPDTFTKEDFSERVGYIAQYMIYYDGFLSPEWRNGRRSGLKIRRGVSLVRVRVPSPAPFHMHGRMSKALQLEIRVSCAFDHPVKGEFFERVGAEIAKPHCGHTQYGRGERLNLGLS